jgi:hypothetical protein
MYFTQQAAEDQERQARILIGVLAEAMKPRS